MIRRAGIISFFLMLAVCLAGAPDVFSAKSISSPTCVTQNKLVESTIAEVARKLKGQEYCQFRRYQALFDVDGDGVDDFIVLFTVEGIGGAGNDHYDFMSVFLSGRKWKPLTVKTGERGERDPVSADVRDHRIILETMVYLPSDAMCCPSGKGTLVYEIHGNNLKLAAETKEQEKPAAPREKE